MTNAPMTELDQMLRSKETDPYIIGRYHWALDAFERTVDKYEFRTIVDHCFIDIRFRHRHRRSNNESVGPPPKCFNLTDLARNMLLGVTDNNLIIRGTRVSADSVKDLGKVRVHKVGHYYAEKERSISDQRAGEVI